MNKPLAFLIFMFFAIFVGIAILHAQGGSQTSFVSVPGPLTSCPAPTAGTDALCDVTGVGWEESIAGAAYVPFNQAGPPGPAGQNGTNGINGTNGANGTAATITVGTITTLAPGAQATVTNSGTANAAVLNFGIPQGATGAQGPASSWKTATCPVWSGGSSGITLGSSTQICTEQ